MTNTQDNRVSTHNDVVLEELAVTKSCAERINMQCDRLGPDVWPTIVAGLLLDLANDEDLFPQLTTQLIETRRATMYQIDYRNDEPWIFSWVTIDAETYLAIRRIGLKKSEKISNRRPVRLTTATTERCGMYLSLFVASLTDEQLAAHIAQMVTL